MPTTTKKTRILARPCSNSATAPDRWASVCRRMPATAPRPARCKGQRRRCHDQIPNQVPGEIGGDVLTQLALELVDDGTGNEKQDDGQRAECTPDHVHHAEELHPSRSPLNPTGETRHQSFGRLGGGGVRNDHASSSIRYERLRPAMRSVGSRPRPRAHARSSSAGSTDTAPSGTATRTGSLGWGESWAATSTCKGGAPSTAICRTAWLPRKSRSVTVPAIVPSGRRRRRSARSITTCPAARFGTATFPHGVEATPSVIEDSARLAKPRKRATQALPGFSQTSSGRPTGRHVRPG